MVTSSTIATPKALLWCPGEHLGRLLEAARGAGWRVVGVGVPPRSGTLEWSESVDTSEVARYDDPRVGVAESGADVVLFADPSPLDDPGVAKLCQRSGLMTLSLGPSPDGVHTWTRTEADEARVRVVPLLVDSLVHASAVEALEPLGAVTGASVRMSAPPALGGVPARLYDAMRLVHRHLGVPEQVHASCPRVKGEGEARIRELAGSLHAHLRSPGWGATIALHDAVNTLARDVVFECGSGVLRLTDEGFVVIDTAATVVDKGEGSGTDPLIEQLARATDPRLPAPAPYERGEVLAMCEAAALSVRTGQPERPHDLLTMMRG
ncbi:MAG: hypothetical protein Tsb0013_01530 [Phycisphaerales bacterium]